MKRIVLLALAAALAVLWLVWPGDDFMVGGIQVNEADHERWMEALDEDGFDTTSVTVYAHQGDWDSDNLWWDDEDAGVEAEVRAARAAGVRVVLILRVALDHAFERNRFLWHGMIQPATDELLDAWFERYERFVRQWAEFAEAEGIEVLAISSELNSMTSTEEIEELPALHEFFINQETQQAEKAKLLQHAARVDERHLAVRGNENFDEYEGYLDARAAANGAWARQVTWHDEEGSIDLVNRRRRELDRRWRAIAAAAREVYGGALTYAANFDQYHEVGFWDAFDLIGVNAYFELRRRWRPLPDVDRLLPELRSGWRAVLAEIDDFRRRRKIADLPVVFTELGYSRRRNCTLRPWSATGFAVMPTPDGREKLVIWEDEPISLRERTLAVRALLDEHRAMPQPMLAGILWWKLTTEPAHVDVEPYVVVLGDSPADPVVDELAAFRRPAAFERIERPIRDLRHR
jgi:hypothetical protein